MEGSPVPVNGNRKGSIYFLGKQVGNIQGGSFIQHPLQKILLFCSHIDVTLRFLRIYLIVIAIIILDYQPPGLRVGFMLTRFVVP